MIEIVISLKVGWGNLEAKILTIHYMTADFSNVFFFLLFSTFLAS